MTKRTTQVQRILYAKYKEHRSGGEVCEGQENDAWPSYEPVYYDIQFLSLHREIKKEPYALYETVSNVSPAMFDADSLYLATIIYSDGSTFGSTHGHRHVVGVYPTYERGEKAIEAAKAGDGYKPWEGYFSSYEGSEVVKLTVHD